MTATAVRLAVVAVLVVHGLIHLMGAAAGLAGVEVDALTEPVSTAMGVVWLVAAGLVLAAAGLLAARVRWWWLVGGVALVVSQAAIVTAWSDAWAGTLANVVLLVAVLHGAAAEGPGSLRATERKLAAAELARPAVPGVVTEADLAHLPGPVAAYVRRSGAVGQARVSGFRAAIHGRIRGGPDDAWMPFTGEQVNRVGDDPSRLFLIRATMKGIPVDVFHHYLGSSAVMRAKAASVVTVVDGRGPEMDQAETVTLFNDLCVLAPAGLVDPAIRWEPVDDRRVRGIFGNAGRTISAELVFDGEGDLVDFVSDDRFRADAAGKRFDAQRWSTPLTDYRWFGRRRLASHGEGWWHPPEGPFAYLEFVVDDISCVTAGGDSGSGTLPAVPSQGER